MGTDPVHLTGGPVGVMIIVVIVRGRGVLRRARGRPRQRQIDQKVPSQRLQERTFERRSPSVS